MKFVPNQTLVILPAHPFLPHQFLPLLPFALDGSGEEQHLIADSKWRRGVRVMGGSGGGYFRAPSPYGERESQGLCYS